MEGRVPCGLVKAAVEEACRAGSVDEQVGQGRDIEIVDAATGSG